MANKTKTLTAKHGRFRFYDFGYTNLFTVDFTDGVIELDEPGPDVIEHKNRGDHQDPPDLSFDQQQDVSGSFSARLTEGTDASFATILDILRDDGGSTSKVETAWVPTNGATSQVPCYGFEIWETASAYSGGGDIRTRIPYCRFTYSISRAMSGNMIAIKFRGFVSRATLASV